MNVIQLLELNDFGVTLIIVTVVVAIAELLLKRFGALLPNFAVNYLPLLISFIAGIALQYAYTGNVEVTEELICGGLMAYSLGTVIAVWIRKLFRGEISEDELFMLVKSIVLPLVNENSAGEISAIVKLLRGANAVDNETLKNRIADLLKKTAKIGVSEAQIAAVAEKILLSANSLKEK